MQTTSKRRYPRTKRSYTNRKPHRRKRPPQSLAQARARIAQSEQEMLLSPSVSQPKKKVIYQILTAACVVVMIASAVYIANYVYELFAHKNISSGIASLYDNISASNNNGAGPASPAGPANAEGVTAVGVDGEPIVDITTREALLLAEVQGRARFSELLAINTDFRGMLTIEGLNIKEPYVQYIDNDRYLNTDFKGGKSSYGTIFMSCYNDRLLTDKNIVFFGHHMRTNEMFTSLVKYRDINTLNEAPVVVLDSLTGKTEWLVFAAYTCEPDYGYIDTKVEGDAFGDLLDEILSRSIFLTDIDVSESDQIITLSTCAYDFQDARFAVHARKLRPGETIPGTVNVYLNPSPKPYNVPKLMNIAEVAANSTAVLRHPSSGKIYLYQIGASGIEWYVGNTWQVQGPYNCYAGAITSSGYISALTTTQGRTLLAVDRMNGQAGVSLFSSSLPSGRFSLVTSAPVTEGIDALYPLLYADSNDDVWLLYTIFADEKAQEHIYKTRIGADGAMGESELLITANEGAGLRAAGMAELNGRTIFIWHETKTRTVHGKYLGGTEAVLSITGDVKRITFYGGLSDNDLRFVSEANGRLNFGTFDISEVPTAGLPPIVPAETETETEETEPSETETGEGEVTEAEEDGETEPEESETEEDGETEPEETEEEEGETDEEPEETETEGAEAVQGEAEEAEETESESGPEAPIGAPTQPRLIIGGKVVAFNAYNINDYNYFRATDLADAFKDTNTGFTVSFSDTSNAVVIDVNGIKTDLPTYHIINGDYYINLRELTDALNVKLTYNGSIIVITDSE